MDRLRLFDGRWLLNSYSDRGNRQLSNLFKLLDGDLGYMDFFGLFWGGLLVQKLSLNLLLLLVAWIHVENLLQVIIEVVLSWPVVDIRQSGVHGTSQVLILLSAQIEVLLSGGLGDQVYHVLLSSTEHLRLIIRGLLMLELQIRFVRLNLVYLQIGLNSTLELFLEHILLLELHQFFKATFFEHLIETVQLVLLL